MMKARKRDQFRSEIYRHLTQCFYRPYATIYERILELSDAVCELYPEFVKYLPDNVEETDLLLTDYTILLDESASVSEQNGVESLMEDVFYDNHGVMTEKIIGLCKKAGFEIIGNFEPHHIAFLLQFAEFLLHKIFLVKGNSNARKDVSYYTTIFNDLLTVHLYPRMEYFYKLTLEKAKTKFYKNLGRFAYEFICEEVKFQKQANDGED